MKKIFFLAVAVALTACTAAQVSAWQTALASPQAQALVAGALNFDPAVQKIVAKLNSGVAGTAADKAMVCGAMSWANGLFALAAPMSGVSSSAQSAESSAMAGVETVCNSSTADVAGAVYTVLGAYVATTSALQGSGVLPAPSAVAVQPA